VQRSVAIGAAVLALAAGAWWLARGDSSSDPPPEEATASGPVVEAVPLPPGVSGGAVHVAAHDPVRATCWGDGCVTIRREGAVVRVPPPSPTERFRRVAVPRDGVVFALSTRGGLYDLSASPPRRLAVRGIQAGAHVAAGAASDDLWIGGESGALIHVIRPGEAVETEDRGDPSVTAIVAVDTEDGPAAWVGRADGSVSSSRDGAPLPEVAPSAVEALARGDGHVAGLDARGALHEWPAPWAVEFDPDGTDVLRVLDGAPSPVPGLGRPVALVTMRPRPRRGRFDLAAVFAPDLAAFLVRHEWLHRVALGSRAHAACAIERGAALLVAAEAGERIVRFRP
jgi:hypothetical protein